MANERKSEQQRVENALANRPWYHYQNLLIFVIFVLPFMAAVPMLAVVMGVAMTNMLTYNGITLLEVLVLGVANIFFYLQYRIFDYAPFRLQSLSFRAKAALTAAFMLGIIGMTLSLFASFGILETISASVSIVLGYGGLALIGVVVLTQACYLWLHPFQLEGYQLLQGPAGDVVVQAHIALGGVPYAEMAAALLPPDEVAQYGEPEVHPGAEGQANPPQALPAQAANQSEGQLLFPGTPMKLYDDAQQQYVSLPEGQPAAERNIRGNVAPSFFSPAGENKRTRSVSVSAGAVVPAETAVESGINPTK